MSEPSARSRSFNKHPDVPLEDNEELVDLPHTEEHEQLLQNTRKQLLFLFVLISFLNALGAQTFSAAPAEAMEYFPGLDEHGIDILLLYAAIMPFIFLLPTAALLLTEAGVHRCIQGGAILVINSSNRSIYLYTHILSTLYYLSICHICVRVFSSTYPSISCLFISITSISHYHDHHLYDKVFLGLGIRSIPAMCSEQFRHQNQGFSLILLHLGQLINAGAFPLFMASPSTLSQKWFPPSLRTTITAESSVAAEVGFACAYLSGDFITSSTDLANVLITECIVSLVCCILTLILMARIPFNPAGLINASQSLSGGSENSRDDVYNSKSRVRTVKSHTSLSEAEGSRGDGVVTSPLVIMRKELTQAWGNKSFVVLCAAVGMAGPVLAHLTSSPIPPIAPPNDPSCYILNEPP